MDLKHCFKSKANLTLDLFRKHKLTCCCNSVMCSTSVNLGKVLRNLNMDNWRNL